MTEWLPVIVSIGAVAISFANLLLSKRDRLDAERERQDGEARLKGILEERDRQRDRELSELRTKYEKSETWVLHERVSNVQREIGDHTSGIKGRLHAVENKAQAHEMRLATLERQRRGDR